jgi:hypothetical protein
MMNDQQPVTITRDSSKLDVKDYRSKNPFKNPTLSPKGERTLRKMKFDSLTSIFLVDPFYNTAKQRPHNFECLLVTAHIRRSDFRKTDFQVGFDYFKFLNDAMSKTSYTFYEADIGLRAVPQNNYEDAGTAIDKELRRLLKFELNDQGFIQKSGILKRPISEAMPLIQAFNAPLVEHQLTHLRVTKDPKYKNDHPNSINETNENLNEWTSVFIAREFVYCFRSVELVTYIGFFVYKTKVVGKSKKLLVHYRPWLDPKDPQSPINVLYPRSENAQKIENVGGRNYVTDYQQEFFLEIINCKEGSFTHLILRNYNRAQLDYIIQNQISWKNTFNDSNIQPVQPIPTIQPGYSGGVQRAPIQPTQRAQTNQRKDDSESSDEDETDFNEQSNQPVQQTSQTIHQLSGSSEGETDEDSAVESSDELSENEDFTDSDSDDSESSSNEISEGEDDFNEQDKRRANKDIVNRERNRQKINEQQEPMQVNEPALQNTNHLSSQLDATQIAAKDTNTKTSAKPKKHRRLRISTDNSDSEDMTLARIQGNISNNKGNLASGSSASAQHHHTNQRFGAQSDSTPYRVFYSCSKTIKVWQEDKIVHHVVDYVALDQDDPIYSKHLNSIIIVFLKIFFIYFFLSSQCYT